MLMSSLTVAIYSDLLSDELSYQFSRIWRLWKDEFEYIHISSLSGFQECLAFVQIQYREIISQSFLWFELKFKNDIMNNTSETVSRLTLFVLCCAYFCTSLDKYLHS